MILESLVSVFVIFALVVYLYIHKAKFGKAPKGIRLERIKKSPHYINGKFQNIHPSPRLTEGYTVAKVLKESLFQSHPRRKPTKPLPSIQTNLQDLAKNEQAIVWFGHSSYFLQLMGKRFLIDPVFSGNASPIPKSVKSFTGTDVYSASLMPEIDYLLITHDHYDHLDYATIMALKDKINIVICGLGVGAHFEHWGFDSKKIIELDWNEKLVLNDTITLYTETTKHFAGRSFSANNTLWLSFVLKTSDLKLFLGGDGGYDTHFSEIGKKHDGFDLAILENGQYNPAWRPIHMFPNEVLKAVNDLKAKRVFPVHSSKFSLSQHPWDEPLEKITALNQNAAIKLLTPMIGEKIDLSDENQQFTAWWKNLD